ncbi:hypothetical protein EJD97_019491, partial [Solanum chilense]
MNFGVVHIGEKDFFNIIIKSGKPWKTDDCGMYTSLFIEYINNDVFDISYIDIDATYYHQRYAIILWHYGKTKNEEGAISDSEVTSIVASKYGGPRI